MVSRFFFVKKLFFSKTGRDVIINTVGNYLNIGFALFFVLLLTRILGRVEYGTMTVLLNISYILANVMEFGTTSTIYSYMPNLYSTKSNRSELLGFIKTIFYYQSTISVIAIVILIAIFPLLDDLFFKTDSPIMILIWTALSVLGFVWQNTLLNMFFAVKKFFEANLWLNISNIVKTALILILLPFGVVDIGVTIFIFGVIGPLIFILIAIFRRPKIARSLIFETSASGRHFKTSYTMTNFFATQLVSLAMRMDLFVLSYFRMPNAVADYGLAQKIILTIISTVVSITQVLSPRFASIRNRVEAVREIRHSVPFLLVPTAMFVALIFIPDWIYYLIFTDKFADMPVYARMLGGAYALFCVGQIFNLLHLYTFKKPIILLLSNVVFMFIVTAICLAYIPKFGVAAGPIALAIAFTVSTIIQAFSTKLCLARMPARS
jgi:O-antigen/teichoic acid export membrane protein